MTRKRISTTATLAVLTLALTACDPGNMETRIGERTLTPQSAIWGRAHYHHDGILFLDDNYDVTWIVVSDHPGACEHFARYMACDPTKAKYPDGLQLSVRFNSFVDEYNSVEDTGGDVEINFYEMTEGEPTWTARAEKGSLNGRGESGDRIYGTYHATLDTGDEVEGTWSADYCDALSDVLVEEFAERDHCED